MGTLAVSAIRHSVENNKLVKECVVNGSASYATGGDTIPLSTLGLKMVDAVEVVGKRQRSGHYHNGDAVTDAQAQTGYSVQLGGTVLIPKLKYFNVANTEISAAVDLSTIALVIRFIGI